MKSTSPPSPLSRWARGGEGGEVFCCLIKPQKTLDFYPASLSYLSEIPFQLMTFGKASTKAVRLFWYLR